MTLITLVTNVFLNVPILLGLIWFEANGWGLFNILDQLLWIELMGAVIILDLAWYVTHVSLHKFGILWRIHSVHHSDPAVDVTTTIRQHPLEGLVRYVYLVSFALFFGVSVMGFALYRISSVLYGQFEHANIRLPQWLDTTITFLAASPNMHKIHHSNDARFTDSNYSSLLNWDRLFGTFIPSKFGRDIDYGLDGYGAVENQTAGGLLRLPFRSQEAADDGS